KPVDYATDVWAMGVIFHEMLAGERLFADETPLATIQRVVHDALEPPSRKCPTVPTALDRLVMTALQRGPKARLTSAHAMADELSAWLREHPVQAPAGPTTPHAFDEPDLAGVLATLSWEDDTARMRPSHNAIRLHSSDADRAADAADAARAGALDARDGAA